MIAEFLGGVYRTNVESEIAEFDLEIKNGLKSIWAIQGQEVVDSEDIDPIAVMKRKIIAEYEAEKKRSLDNGTSFSDTSGAGKAAGSNVAGVNAASSNSVGAAKAVSVGSIKINK